MVIFRKNPAFDFTVPQPHTSDGVLVIDGIRLHVSKAVLLHIHFYSFLSYEVKKERIKGKEVDIKKYLEKYYYIYYILVFSRWFISLVTGDRK